MTTYKQLTLPDKKGYIEVERGDGKVALAKDAWFKPAFEGSDFLLVPRSRAKAIRMEMLEWKKRAKMDVFKKTKSGSMSIEPLTNEV